MGDRLLLTALGPWTTHMTGFFCIVAKCRPKAAVLPVETVLFGVCLCLSAREWGARDKAIVKGSCLAKTVLSPEASSS